MGVVAPGEEKVRYLKRYSRTAGERFTAKVISYPLFHHRERKLNLFFKYI